MARKVLGRKYNEMPEKYLNSNSREEFREQKRAARRERKDEALAEPRSERFAGDAVFDVVKGESFAPTLERKGRVDGRIARMEQRQAAGKNINEERLQNRYDRQEKLAGKIAAQDKFDGTLQSYDFGSFGGPGAGLKDVERLSSEGFSAREIADEIEGRGIAQTDRAQTLLARYMNDNMPEATPEVEEVTDEGIAFEPPSPSENTVTIDQPIGGEPLEGGIGSPTVATGVIGGNTGDVGLTDSSNYGTINTGVINDIRNYGGGYSAGSNNTGTAQAYIDMMQENLEKYSGDKYGMYITDSRTKKADDLRGIDSNAIYGSLNQFAGNMYDRGLIGASNLYGDPYRFPTAQYGGFQDIDQAEEKKKA